MADREFGMRNMTNEEMKKLYESLKEEIEKAAKDGAFSVGNWNTSAQPMTTKHTIPPLPPIPNIPSYYGPSPITWGNGVSPTDKDGHSQYEYQEPEVDEQGTYYGYKILRIKNPDCGCQECSILYSPLHHNSIWNGGELEADREPNEKTMFGIHFTKRPDHPNLREYMDDYRIRQGYYQYGGFRGESSVLVKCALSGTIVETEQGFRSQHAIIVGVYYDGNWKSYQDYQKCAAANTSRIAEEERRVVPNTATRYYTWDFRADWDSNP